MTGPKTNKARALKALLAAGAAGGALALAGCVSLLPEPQPTTLYRLTTTTETGELRAPRGAPIIRIERPITARALALDRVALSTGEGRIAYMSGVSWVSPAPVLIQELILDTFDRTAARVSAARPDDAVEAAWGLRPEVRRFEAVYDRGEDAAPMVEVSIRARLFNTTDRRVTAVRTFETERRAASNRQGAIIDAFSAAASEAALDMAGWAEGEIVEFDPETAEIRPWRRGEWRTGEGETPPDRLPEAEGD